MPLQQFEILCQRPFCLSSTVLSHGWVMLAPWEWDGATLSRMQVVDGQCGQLAVIQTGNKLVCKWSGRQKVDQSLAVTIINRWLSLDWDNSDFLAIANRVDPDIANYVRNGGGRFLRSSCFFEDFVKTVCTINTTWNQTKKMIAAIAEMFDGYFPSPRQILQLDHNELIIKCKIGFRSKTILEATKNMIRDKFVSLNGDGFATYAYLNSLWGIGPYAASHLMVLQRDYSNLPIDSDVLAYLARKGIAESGVATYYSQWGAYAFLGYKLRRILDKENWIGCQVI
jgi:N-glycosylase/DNA lyase